MKFEAEPEMPLDHIKCRLDSYRGNLFKTNVSIFYPVVLIALNASGHMESGVGLELGEMARCREQYGGGRGTGMNGDAWVLWARY